MCLAGCGPPFLSELDTCSSVLARNYSSFIFTVKHAVLLSICNPFSREILVQVAAYRYQISLWTSLCGKRFLPVTRWVKMQKISKSFAAFVHDSTSFYPNGSVVLNIVFFRLGIHVPHQNLHITCWCAF